MLHWLRRRTRAEIDADDGETARDVRAAREALACLEQDIAQARERTSEIREISRTLRTLGERNHFAPLIRDALGGRFE